MITFIMLIFLVTQSIALLRAGSVDYLQEKVPQMLNFAESGECAPSFECDILAAVCDYLNETCTLVHFPNRNTLFNATQDGEVDIAMSLNMVSPESSEIVHFVRPHYYYAGSQVYILDTVPESEHPTWEDLRGKNVCTPHGWYANSGIEYLYGANLLDIGGDTEYIMNDTCEYIVSGSVDGNYMFQGLVGSTQARVMFGAPISIAVSIDERDGLGAKISEALLDMMDDGQDSLMLEIERRNLICCGFPPSKKLLAVVEAITENGGALSPAVEDGIWDI